MLDQAAALTKSEVNAAVWKAYQLIFSLEPESAGREATDQGARRSGGMVTNSEELGDAIQPVAGEFCNRQHLEQYNMHGEQAREDHVSGESVDQGS